MSNQRILSRFKSCLCGPKKGTSTGRKSDKFNLFWYRVNLFPSVSLLKPVNTQQNSSHTPCFWVKGPLPQTGDHAHTRFSREFTDGTIPKTGVRVHNEVSPDHKHGLVLEKGSVFKKFLAFLTVWKKIYIQGSTEIHHHPAFCDIRTPPPNPSRLIFKPTCFHLRVREHNPPWTVCC